MLKIPWIKSVFDGWPTAFRKHETARPCLFCRSSRPDDTDHLKHIIRCPVLWAFIRQMKQRESVGTVADHLCIHEPNANKFFDLYLALDTYQSISCLPNASTMSVDLLGQYFRECNRKIEAYW